jgi:LPXTG-motif cell wall-anchored protein
MNDWQTWAALAAVLLAVLFLLGKTKRKKKKSCGHDCGCGKGK